MDSCPHCGAPSSGGAYCSSCGKALRGVYAPTVPAPPRPAAVAPAAPTQVRPVGVQLVTIGFALLAGLCVLGAIAVLAFGTVASAFAETWLDESWFPWQGAIAAFMIVAAFAVLLFAGLCAAVAWGLHNAQAWAWILAIVIAVLAGLGDLASFAQGDVGSLLGILVWGGLVYYFLRPEVRAYFNRPAA